MKREWPVRPHPRLLAGLNQARAEAPTPESEDLLAIERMIEDDLRAKLSVAMQDGEAIIARCGGKFFVGSITEKFGGRHVRLGYDVIVDTFIKAIDAPEPEEPSAAIEDLVPDPEPEPVAA